SAQVFIALVLRLPFELIDRLVKFVGFGWIAAPLRKEFLPGIAAAQANHEVIGSQSDGAKRVDQQRNQFGIGGEVFLADNICVELEMFSKTPLLLALVSEELRNRIPFDGLLVVALMRCDHSGEGGRHFRAQCDGAVSFVLEAVELADDFVPAFGSEQFKWLHGRSIVFPKAIAARNRAPTVKNILACVRA